MKRSLAICVILSFVGLFMLSSSVLAAPTKPPEAPPAPLADPTQSSTPYAAPARRTALLSPQDQTSPLATLFDPVAARQAKVFHEMSSLQLQMNTDVADVIEAYYDQPKAKLVWVDGKGATAKAAQALNLMKQAGDWGLAPEDYAVSTTFESLPEGSPEQMKASAQFEVALSGKMLMFLQDNFRERIDPNQLSHYYDFKRKSVDLKTTMSQLSVLPDLTPTGRGSASL